MDLRRSAHGVRVQAKFRDVATIARRNGTAITTFESLEDLTPRSSNPIIGRVESHYVSRLHCPEKEIVESLDHRMTSGRGRINLLPFMDASV